MTAETLLTAAHRLNRFFRIDMQHGGLIVVDTLAALETLDQQIAQARAGAPHDAAVLSAAADAARSLHLDTNEHGGMVAVKTEIAFDQLDKAIRAVGGRPAAEEAVA